MIPLIITLSVVALIFLLPVSLVVYYDNDFKFYVRVLSFKIPVRISRKSDKKRKKRASEKDVGQKKKTDSGGFLSKLCMLRDLALSVCKRMHFLLVIKHLDISVAVATGDPCTTALTYGGINAAIYSFVSYLEKGFRIKKRDISITADYSADKMQVYFYSELTTFLLRLLIFLSVFLFDGAKIMLNKEN